MKIGTSDMSTKLLMMSQALQLRKRKRKEEKEGERIWNPGEYHRLGPQAPNPRKQEFSLGLNLTQNPQVHSTQI